VREREEGEPIMEKWEQDLAAANERLDDLTEENERLTAKLERVADIMADAGIIHNTPQAKREWVEQ